MREVKEGSSINQRYFYKISSNVIAIFAGIATSAIVPRALGVNAYGDFSFTNNVITQVLNFLDLKASTCFYVKLSQRQSESQLITFYGLYTILVFVLLLITIGALTFPESRRYLFENINRSIVWFSFLLVTVKSIADTFIRISDAYGTTRNVERIKILNSILSTLVLVLLFYFNAISINTFYVHQIVTFSLLVILIYFFFKRNKYKVPLIGVIEKTTFQRYSKEFVAFSFPLAFYLTSSLVTEVFDRYILQYYGGSYQQGLYGFSFAMSSMMILFVTAIVPLFTRELSIAFSNNNIELASDLYRKYAPTMYVVSAYFCCFIFVNAENVLMLFAGEQYKESLIPLRIMLLYPLVSTYSNLNGSVIYAKSGNFLYRNIALVIHPLGMIVAYLLISNYFMNMGATGLAIKVLALEIVSVVIVMFYVSKHLKIKLSKYFVHMIFSPIALLSVAFGVKLFLIYSFEPARHSIFIFLLSGLLYTAFCGLIIYFFPIFVGVSRENINGLTEKLKAFGR